MIVATSSEGTVRNGAGDTIKMELQDILKGEYINPHVSIWWYKLDSVEEVSNPDMWLKANPNLGKTVSYETYQLDVERAEKAPAARNDILAKRFGLPMEGYTYYFTYEETLPHRKRDFWQLPCSLGGDLSQGDDFCAFTFLFPLSNGAFGVKTRNYITQRTLMKLQPAMRLKYEEFIKEGSLIVMEGTVLDGPFALAMTQDGQIVADFVKTGTMSANRINGGTLILGGKNNSNGTALIKDSYGKVLIRLDRDGITLSEDVQISYENISDAPSIPTKVSELTNDSKYTTMPDVEKKGYQTKANVTKITKDTVPYKQDK